MSTGTQPRVHKYGCHPVLPGATPPTCASAPDLRAVRAGDVWYCSDYALPTEDKGRPVSRKGFESQAKKACSVGG